LEASPGHTVRPCLKIKKKTKRKGGRGERNGGRQRKGRKKAKYLQKTYLRKALCLNK
jgi:hypothetical protein